MTIKRATVAAPIFKNIAEDAISILKIPVPSAGLEKEYRYFDTKFINVGDVVGYSVDDAKKILKDFTIEYSGRGNNVISMSPVAGSRVAVGSVVRLMLG